MSLKTITDPVHGTIQLNGLQESLMDLPELQRLAWISQAGLVKLVYPGANQSRLEHGLGVSHLAGKIADALEVGEKEKLTAQAAGLLHDIGHPPFSHSLEPLMPIDHMEYTADLVTGRKKMPLPGAGQIADVLKRHGISPKAVGDIVSYRGRGIVQSIIRGPIDADQLDYLSRDAHYTGVSYGIVGVDRIIGTMAAHGGEICILEKGISSAEEMFLAKEHMYASVYYHHTAQIASKMLIRAVESALDDMPGFYNYTDGELLQALRNSNPYANDMAERIIYRNLLKRAFSVTSVAGADVSGIAKKGEKAVERELEKRTGIASGYVLAHIYRGGSEIDEAKERRKDIKILMNDGTVRRLTEISGVMRAIADNKMVHDVFAVYCLPKNKALVEKAARKMVN